MSLKLIIEPINGVPLKFGNYATLDDALAAGKRFKDMQFTGRLYVEYIPSLIELTLKDMPHHIERIYV